MGSGELGGASIYILRCSDGSYYTGITRRSVEERVSEHAQGLMPGYTFTRRPVKLALPEHYESSTRLRRRGGSRVGRERRRPTCAVISRPSCHFRKEVQKRASERAAGRLA